MQPERQGRSSGSLGFAMVSLQKVIIIVSRGRWNIFWFNKSQIRSGCLCGVMISLSDDGI